MSGYILALDQGTTGSTAVIIDEQSSQFVGKKNMEFKQIFPKPSWVEHDLNEIWQTIEKTVTDVLSENNVKPEQISAIAITNQRETTCAFDKDGTPLENAIVWQDRRTENFCLENEKVYNNKFKKMTGLPLDAYFSGTKMRWFLDNSSKVQAAKSDGSLHFGTIDTFLLYKLTNGSSYFTEHTNASRTLLLNLETLSWDNKLCDFFGISIDNLPKIKDSIGEFGITNGLDFLPDGIPIMCILGDQQAALFGQASTQPGDFKCTYGTGSFALANTGEKIIHSDKGLLTTIAYSHNEKTYYALEGACYIAGAAVQWLRDNIKLFKESKDIESMAMNASDESMENLLFLPFFTGIASPHWVSDAKAAIVGLTRDTSKNQISRACLEGVCLSIKDLYSSFESQMEIERINVDGGACANDFWMQSQANFLGRDVLRPVVIETTAYGVGLGALIGLGKINIDDVRNLWKLDKKFKSKQSNYHNNKSTQWKKMIKTLYL
jgi:glycerol kinase